MNLDLSDMKKENPFKGYTRESEKITGGHLSRHQLMSLTSRQTTSEIMQILTCF